jgi:uncharacterized membrane protein YbhN (UPF0104 family)
MSKLWRLLGSAVLLGVLALRLDWHQIGAAFAALDWSLWMIALGLFALAQVVSALRWRLLARAVGLDGSIGPFLADYYAGMFCNLFLPSSVGGDVVRAWRLVRRCDPGVPGARLNAALSVLADRLSGLIVLIILCCAAAVICPTPLPFWVVGCVAGLGAAAALSLAALPLLRHVLLPRLRIALPRYGGVFDTLQRLTDGAVLTMQNGPVLFWSTVLSVVVHAANVVLVWVIGVGMGLHVPLASWGVIVPLVALLTLLPISVGGVGLRETGFIVLLHPLGVSAATAVTVSLLSFAVYTAASLGGVFVLFGGPSRSTIDSRPSLEVRFDDQSVGGDPDQGRTRQPPAAA